MFSFRFETLWEGSDVSGSTHTHQKKTARYATWLTPAVLVRLTEREIELDAVVEASPSATQLKLLGPTGEKKNSQALWGCSDEFSHLSFLFIVFLPPTQSVSNCCYLSLSFSLVFLLHLMNNPERLISMGALRVMDGAARCTKEIGAGCTGLLDFEQASQPCRGVLNALSVFARGRSFVQPNGSICFYCCCFVALRVAGRAR